MKIQLLIILGMATTVSVCAQSPQAEAWIMNTTGATASYENSSGSIIALTDATDVTQVCYTTDTFYVTCSGLSSYQMGPWSGNSNVPANQNYIFGFPMNPSEGSPKSDAPKGGIGVMIDGVVMYGSTDNASYDSGTGNNVSNGGDDIWHTDAWVNEGPSMDATAGGHPDQGSNYHYHANPHTLYTDPSTSHSPIIGYLYDGFPIYGPFGYSDAMDASSSITRMAGSYQLRNITVRTTLPDGSTSSPAGPAVTTGGEFDLGEYVEDWEFSNGLGHLDEYNGRNCVTPEYPGGTYAYFISTDSNGDPYYPYTTGPQIYGQYTQVFGQFAGDETVPAGATCSTVGIEAEMVRKLEINLSPNPVSGSLSIELNEMELDGATIRFTDQLGRTVYTVTGKIDNSIHVDVSKWANGVYFCSLESDGSKHVTKFIVATN